VAAMSETIKYKPWQAQCLVFPTPTPFPRPPS
jgi:hypothetical protein